jgi:predicted O-methyltransferase YrrM
MSIAHVLDLTKDVEGFLSQNGETLWEGEILYHLARSLPASSRGVEIGSWMGKSTIWISKGLQSTSTESRLYAIDPHTGSEEHQSDEKAVWTFPQFEKNIIRAGVASSVIPLTMFSHEGASHIEELLDFAFIDGAHDFDSVKIDFETWFPKMKSGGVMAFHDSFVGWPGVQKFVDRYVFLSKNFKNVRYINSITYATKVEQATFTERLHNLVALFVKKVHTVSLKFPQPFKSFVKKLIWRPYQQKWLKELREAHGAKPS